MDESGSEEDGESDWEDMVGGSVLYELPSLTGLLASVCRVAVDLVYLAWCCVTWLRLY